MKEEELIAQFRAQGAQSRAAAMTPSALCISEDLTFRRLRERDVIREGTPGTYYLDEEAVAARHETRKRMRTVAIIIAIILALVTIGLQIRTSGGAY